MCVVCCVVICLLVGTISIAGRVRFPSRPSWRMCCAVLCCVQLFACFAVLAPSLSVCRVSVASRDHHGVCALFVCLFVPLCLCFVVVCLFAGIISIAAELALPLETIVANELFVLSFVRVTALLVLPRLVVGCRLVLMLTFVGDETGIISPRSEPAR
jgi:hypothetical protein